MPTLLEKATAIKTKKKTIYTLEDFDIAIAWLTSQISVTQYSLALNNKSTANCLYHAACALRWGFENGLLIIKKKA